MKQIANLVPTTGSESSDDLNRYSLSFLHNIENIQRLDIANLISSAVLDPVNSFNLYFIQTSPPPFDFILLFVQLNYNKDKRFTNSLFHKR